jgi:uncharacterized protein YecT (DUF1311 family)
VKYIFLLLGLLIQTITFSQTHKDPVEVTPELLVKLKQEIEREVPGIKSELEITTENTIRIEFTLDTFKIERLIIKMVDLDYSDIGLYNAVYEAAKGYDILLNKYYKKLLAALKGDDKKALVSAQKSWLSFRDTETKLVETISKDEYSGGGTLQQLTESSAYYNLIKTRTISIFEHYVRAIQNE